MIVIVDVQPIASIKINKLQTQSRAEMPELLIMLMRNQVLFRGREVAKESLSKPSILENLTLPLLIKTHHLILDQSLMLRAGNGLALKICQYPCQNFQSIP